VHVPIVEVAQPEAEPAPKVEEPAPTPKEQKAPEPEKKEDAPKLSCDEIHVLACQFLSDPAVQLVLPELAKAVITKIVQEARSKKDPSESAARVLEVFTTHSVIQNHPAMAAVRPHLGHVQCMLARVLGSIPSQFVDMLDQLKDGFQFNADMLMSLLSNPLDVLSSGVDCGKFDLGGLGLSLSSLAPMLASLGSFSCGPFDFGFECKSPCQEASAESSSDSAHSNVRCDGCNEFPIVGARYNCTVCPDYDLCAKCEASSVHPAEHPLLKFRQPVNTAVVHTGITCDGCSQSPITGIRFKCRTCADYDLCESCEAKNVHPADHPMIKFKVEKARHRGGGHGGCHGGFGGRHPLHHLFRQAFRGGAAELPEGLFSRAHHGWSRRSHWLSQGSVGDAVKEVQKALGVQVDGYFGAKTEQAVKEFQTANSLDADGIVGPRTRAKLIPSEKKEAAPPRAERAKASWWLTKGAMGEAVKEIQQALGVPVDGFFGPRTEQAVKQFQAANGLDADGIVGPRTRAKITPVAEEKKEIAPAVVPPASAPVTPQAAVAAPQEPAESPALTQLINMGFPDVALNAQLLKKHNGDVELVVAELLGA